MSGRWPLVNRYGAPSVYNWGTQLHNESPALRQQPGPCQHGETSMPGPQSNHFFRCQQCGISFYARQLTPQPRFCSHPCYADSLRKEPSDRKVAPCSFPGCGGSAHARGYCVKHYAHLRKHGDPSWTRPSFNERFWTKVDKNGPVIRPELGPCWLWTSATRQGYGVIHYGGGGRVVLAHRASYFLTNESWPPIGLFLCHKCDVRACVRPDHFFLGTNKDNIADMVSKGRWAINDPKRSSTSRSVNLTEEEVRAIRSKRQGGESPNDLARDYSVTRQTIYHVATRFTWKDVI